MYPYSIRVLEKGLTLDKAVSSILSPVVDIATKTQ